MVSWTVTENWPCALLPAASVAEHFTMVVPSVKVLPESGSHSTATEPSTRSLAEGEKL